ncbi:hypothetical protein FRB96_004769 [Tulasnella sp. 330]|nr:hypothetical protein FRB96_004769 [Tulasnella sp. 330]KAG8882407.1 hypothetical protein FRB97_008311 [Tulasnella sp. 331]KAG8888796.1 hypothetical protein FRB98_006808 [Tulasnella sp. 332]
MFLLNAAQLCLQAADIYLAFFKWQGAGGPSGYFMDCGNQILPARDFIFWIEGLVTDAVVCWRLYVIWLKRKDVMIVPLLILISGFVSGVIMFMYTVRRMVNNSPALIPVIDKWWEITLGFTIAINVIVPAIIVGRLWFIAWKLGLIGSNSVRPYKRIALALMESGALYTVAITAWLVIFLSGSLPALYMGACILPTIVAIVPTLIVLRVNTFHPSHDITTADNHSQILNVKVNINIDTAPTTELQLPNKRGYCDTNLYD